MIKTIKTINIKKGIAHSFSLSLWPSLYASLIPLCLINCSIGMVSSNKVLVTWEGSQ